MSENVLKIPKLSASYTWKSANFPKLPTINAWKCAENNKTKIVINIDGHRPLTDNLAGKIVIANR